MRENARVCCPDCARRRAPDLPGSAPCGLKGNSTNCPRLSPQGQRKGGIFANLSPPLALLKGEGRSNRVDPMILLQIIISGLLLGAIYALFSSGLTLIWGMMNFINFAHGEFVMLGMYVALLVVVWLHGGPALFTLASAFALFVLGVVIYASLIRYVLRGPMLSQILSTFGLALLLRYTVFFIFSANFVSLPQTSLSGTVNVGGI